MVKKTHRPFLFFKSASTNMVSGFFSPFLHLCPHFCGISTPCSGPPRPRVPRVPRGPVEGRAGVPASGGYAGLLSISDTTGPCRTQPDYSRTQPDTPDTTGHTGHDRTQPDSIPGHFRTGTRVVLSKTSRTTPDTERTNRTVFRTVFRTAPDSAPDSAPDTHRTPTGHNRTHRTTGHPRLSAGL